MSENSIVLQKAMSASGKYSRRQSDVLIAQGRVKINGKIAALGARVTEKDRIEVDDRILKTKVEKIYLKINKPAEYVCTSAHFKNEHSIFELLATNEKLIICGRLDKDSQGLVIMTNDGDLAQRISHPSGGKEKEYEVTIARVQNINAQDIERRMRSGIDIGDGIAKAKECRYQRNGKFTIILNTGMKRQIRRMFEELGERVIELKRTSIGGITLGTLKEGQYQHLTKEEIEKLEQI